LNAALLFSLEGERFALPSESVREVVRAAWPTRLPRAPFGCLGILDIRGAFVPLLDLAVLLGLRPPQRAERLQERMLDSHVLVIDQDGMAMGLLVDRVLDVGEQEGELGETELSSLQALGRAAALVSGVAVTATSRAMLLSPTALLGAGRRRLLRRAIAEAPSIR
jgi:purine-binding chemotaxis protein CheW